jgi:hypothetical protein
MVNPEASGRTDLWAFIHELGHNQQRDCWEFEPNTTECTCNLWSVYVNEEVLGTKRAEVKKLSWFCVKFGDSQFFFAVFN